MIRISRYEAFDAVTSAMEAGDFILAQRMLAVVSRAIKQELQHGALISSVPLSSEEDCNLFSVGQEKTD